MDAFYTFRLDVRNFDRKLSSLQTRQIQVHLNPVDDLEKIRAYLEQVYNRYKEEFGYYSINIFMSQNAANHIIRIHRILTFTQNGNMLLIGTVGNHLSSLLKLAIYLAELQLLNVDCSKPSQFYDSMRSAVRTAGSENKCVGVIFTSKDLVKSEYLDTINSLLNNGECNDLFSNDEMDGLYHAINSSIKREYPNMVMEPKKFFNTRVKRNLHICLALDPTGNTFQLILQSYSSIINNCQLYWICDWTKEVLLTEANNFMRDRFDKSDVGDKVANCLTDIHMYMLNESRQIPWTGSSERELQVQQTKFIEKKKEQITKTITYNIPNWPYSKSIIQDLIK